MYLGGHTYQHAKEYPRTVKAVSKYFHKHVPNDVAKSLPALYPLTEAQAGRRRQFPYNSVAYILSSEGAQAIVALVNKHGMGRSIEQMVSHLLDVFEDGCYTARPLLVHRSIVSSRGILHMSDVQPVVPFSSMVSVDGMYPVDWHVTMKAGSLVYVTASAIRSFYTSVLSNNLITQPFVLLTGDSDSVLPIDEPEISERVASHPLLLRWYSQNYIGSHTKVSHMPIGLDLHSTLLPGLLVGKPPRYIELVLHSIAYYTPALKARRLMCYSNFHFNMKWRFGYERKSAIAAVPTELVFYESQIVDPVVTWMNQAQYAFVLSPPGNGLDCHRTWEALVLGCIPIVKSSGLDPVFDGLPVLIVKEWSDITLELLSKTRDEHAKRRFSLERLTLQHWVERFRAHGAVIKGEAKHRSG